VAVGGLTDLVIDWRSPWLAPLRELRTLVERADWREALSAEARDRGVATATGMPIEFVAAGDAGAAAYEAHIAATGRVPSRDNAHDLFNALIWLAFPRTKAALNARQGRELARDGVGATRGPVRDAATLIDESGLLLAAGEETCAALMRRDWPFLFATQRWRWGRDWTPFAFGHALIDKLRAPYKGLTAVVVCLPEAAATATQIDRAAAQWVRDAPLAPPLLSHLPVLGIPGWWPANEDSAFYADAAVFRHRRGPVPHVDVDVISGDGGEGAAASARAAGRGPGGAALAEPAGSDGNGGADDRGAAPDGRRECRGQRRAAPALAQRRR